jgi:hypothetical protein
MKRAKHISQVLDIRTLAKINKQEKPTMPQLMMIKKILLVACTLVMIGCTTAQKKTIGDTEYSIRKGASIYKVFERISK